MSLCSKLTVLLLSIFLSFSSYSAEQRSCSDIWNEIISIDGELEDIYRPLQNLCGRDFRDALRRVISTNRDLGYKGARKAFFSDLDNVNGKVCGVYTGKCIRTSGIPNHTVMNCEHSWPQSKGASGIAKSDLHHLYPADARMNSRRSNHPLCEVEDAVFEGQGSALGSSRFGTRCFEPPMEHKGDVARSMMYFSIRYKKGIDREQEGFFRKWHEEDVVSEKELDRNDGIERYQKNRNPFVDHPLFVYLIEDF